MKQLSGRVPDDKAHEVEKLIEDGEYDSVSDFVRFATRFTLSEKHRR